MKFINCIYVALKVKVAYNNLEKDLLNTAIPQTLSSMTCLGFSTNDKFSDIKRIAITVDDKWSIVYRPWNKSEPTTPLYIYVYIYIYGFGRFKQQYIYIYTVV